jgi:hypothetical protein
MVAIVDQHTQGGEQLANSAKGAFHHSTLDCRLGGSDLAHSVPFSEYLEEEEGGGGGSLMLDRKESQDKEWQKLAQIDHEVSLALR